MDTLFAPNKLLVEVVKKRWFIEEWEMMTRGIKKAMAKELYVSSAKLPNKGRNMSLHVGMKIRWFTS